MNVGKCCIHDVVAVSPKDDLAFAAQIMRDKHIGFLVVAENTGNRRMPVGVLTDRDIVVQAVARNAEPRSIMVGDVMTRDPVIVKESDDLEEAMTRLRNNGIRRVPVVDERGALVGVVAVDDAIRLLSGMLSDIAGAVSREQWVERTLRAG